MTWLDLIEWALGSIIGIIAVFFGPLVLIVCSAPGCPGAFCRGEVA